MVCHDPSSYAEEVTIGCVGDAVTVTDSIETLGIAVTTAVGMTCVIVVAEVAVTTIVTGVSDSVSTIVERIVV